MLVGSPVMYDILLFENFRTRKREAGIFRSLSFGDYFVKTCVFSARKRRLLGRYAKTAKKIYVFSNSIRILTDGNSGYPSW